MLNVVYASPPVCLSPSSLPLVNNPHFNHKTSKDAIKSTSYLISMILSIFQTAMDTPNSTPSIHHLTRSDFDNPEVFNAINPHPMFGYFHGPIPNFNPGWKPRRYHDAVTTGSLAPNVPISCSDILQGITSESASLHPMSQLSKSSSTICDIIVGPNGEMCGSTFTLRSSLRLHLRMKHTGAVSPPPPGKTSDLQNESAECALKRWVLFGGWREALYLNEPGRGVGLIEEYCDGLETIAKEDPDFALRFGTRFHRDIVHIQRNTMLDWKYRSEMNCQPSFSNPYSPDAYYGILATATPEAEDHYMDEYAHYAPIQELSKSLAKSCPVTPVKAKCPRKNPLKSSPRKRKIKDSPLKGTVARVNTRIAPKSLFRLSDNAERYLASVLAGGPIDSWNMLDPYLTIDETNLDDVAYGD